MLSGLLTLLTGALSINPLILSRLFGSTGSLSDPLEGTLDYRRSVEDIANVAGSPNEPSAFLTFLADTLKQRLGDFQRGARRASIDFDSEDGPRAYASAVTDYASHLSTAEDFDDPFKVLVPAVLVTCFRSFVYTSASDIPTAIDPAYMQIVVAVTTGVILSPLAVLVVSLLRLATVSLYSVSVGTFTPPRETFGND